MKLGAFPVMRRQCATCIYRPSWRGTPIAVLEDQVREKHRGATGFRGSRICHSHPRGVKATCRGFWERHKDEFAAGQIAQRLGMVEFVGASLMNATQKKELKRIFGELETLQEAAQTLSTELQEEWDEKSEKWQEGEKGQEAEKLKDDVATLVDDIERAKDAVSDHVSE